MGILQIELQSVLPTTSIQCAIIRRNYKGEVRQLDFNVGDWIWIPINKKPGEEEKVYDEELEEH